MKEQLSVSVLSVPECQDKASLFSELALVDSRAACSQVISEPLSLQVWSWVQSEDSVFPNQLFNYKNSIYFTHTCICTLKGRR